jgi:flagellar biogenesis protein FliO
MRGRVVLAGLALWFGVLTMTPPLAFGATGGERPADEARIPYKQSSDGDTAGLAIRVVGGFVLVVLLALGTVYAIKRYLPSLYSHTPTGKRRIQVLEARRLTPRLTLFLVEVDGTQLLLAHSGDRIEQLLQPPTSAPRPASGQ